VRRTTVALVLGAAIMAVAGCSSTTGQPAPATSGSDASGSGSPSSPGGRAPSVTQPALNLSKYEGDPCSMLRTDQLASLGASKPGTRNDSSQVGPECRWLPDDRTNGTAFTSDILTKTRGLDGLYENRSQFQVFRPTQVAGYPAVNVDITDAAHGDCTTSVGTATSAGFQVAVHVRNTSTSDYSNPCSVSEKIAQTIVGNLKGGG
jgi:Protein of unknown function (DUF3558)